MVHHSFAVYNMCFELDLLDSVGHATGRRVTSKQYGSLYSRASWRRLQQRSFADKPPEIAAPRVKAAAGWVTL